jgi:hypothetical protein
MNGVEKEMPKTIDALDDGSRRKAYAIFQLYDRFFADLP